LNLQSRIKGDDEILTKASQLRKLFISVQQIADDFLRVGGYPDMKDAASADQHYRLWWLIIHMRRAMYKARAKELLQYGITPEEAALLFAVQAIGYRATPAEISRWLLREPHSTIGLLNRMERKGLLKRSKDLERKNLVRVAITKKGQQAYSHAAKRESIHRILSSLSKEKCDQLESCAQILRDKALAELGTVQKPPFP